MSAAPDPRLYLVAPSATPVETLTAALAAGDVACVLVTGDAAAGDLIRAAQARDVAALVPDDPRLAVSLGADGVHLTGKASIKRTRATLGDGIVGMACGRSAHAAMIAGEAGADYVAFQGTKQAPDGAPDPELLTWWQVMMTVPCVAMGRIAPDDTGRLAAAGADFVALGDGVWTDPAGPAEAVRRGQEGLDTAR